MTTKELMIGDLIMCHNSNFFVTSVDGYGSLIGIDNERDADLVHIDELTPIPITPEILEKNGFVFDNCFWVIANPKYNVNTLMAYYSVDDDVAKAFLGHWAFDENYAIDYVHELQHALKICGLDELAENFIV